MSPRPKKPRVCCPHRAPGSLVFKPAGIPLAELARIDLNRDELEALRLCDLEGFSQQEAGQRMGVSRGTVQRLAAGGRKKLVAAVLGGQAIVVAPAAPEAIPDQSRTDEDDGESTAG